MATENSCNLSIYQLGILPPPPTPTPRKIGRWGGRGRVGAIFGGFKIFHTLARRDNRVFTAQKLLIPPTRKSILSRLSPPIFIPPSLNSTFLLKIFFSEFYHDIKNTLIYKVNCNLKLSLNSMKLMCFILS